MEKLISFLKTEFPKDALEIQECIELLNQCIGGSVESIKSALGTAVDNRDYAKLSSLQEMLQTVDQVQVVVKDAVEGDRLVSKPVHEFCRNHLYFDGHVESARVDDEK